MVRAASCPVSFETVDHNAGRVTCLLTIAGLAAIAVLAVFEEGLRPIACALAGALTLDYAFRAWTQRKSPLQLGAAALARAFAIPRKPGDAAPKRFACRIGFGFALATVALMPFAPKAAAGVAIALLFFNVLDGVFDFCVGCWMYGLLQPRGAG